MTKEEGKNILLEEQTKIRKGQIRKIKKINKENNNMMMDILEKEIEEKVKKIEFCIM